MHLERVRFKLIQMRARQTTEADMHELENMLKP